MRECDLRCQPFALGVIPTDLLVSFGFCFERFCFKSILTTFLPSFVGPRLLDLLLETAAPQSLGSGFLLLDLSVDSGALLVDPPRLLFGSISFREGVAISIEQFLNSNGMLTTLGSAAWLFALDCLLMTVKYNLTATTD